MEDKATQNFLKPYEKSITNAIMAPNHLIQTKSKIFSCETIYTHNILAMQKYVRWPYTFFQCSKKPVYKNPG